MSTQHTISYSPSSKKEIKTFLIAVFIWVKRLWPLVLPLLLLLPGIVDFPYPSNEAPFSDISIAHYPYAIFFRRALFMEQRLPLWSSLILSGHPFAANPLAGIWYPPGWLTLFLPLPLGFNLLVFLHLLWGGIGLYGLLRSEELEHRPALFAALAFVALPKFFAHYGAGHLTLLYAIPWTPWLLWAGRVSCTHPSKRLLWQQAGILALIFLADVRWSIFAGALWWIYQFAHSHSGGGTKHLTPLLKTAIHLAGQTFLAGLLIAPLALPLAQFVLHTSRSQMIPEDVFTYSLPFIKILGWFFPDFGGFHEWMVYVGAAVLALTLVVFISGSSNSNFKFWLWAAGLSLLFSFGSYIPLLPLFARLPLFNLLRVPSRALFITGLSMIILSAYSIQGLHEGFSSRVQRRVALLLTGLLGFVLILTVGVRFLAGELARNFTWGAVFLTLAGLCILARSRGWIRQDPWFIGLVVISLVDFWGVNRSLFSSRTAADVLSEGQDVAKRLASLNGQFRIYSPSYSIPQQTAAFYDLQLTDGVDPLQLQSYTAYMEQATGVPGDGYSVTMPPFRTGDPNLDNVDYLPDLELLGLLNVEYIAAQYDIIIPGLDLIEQYKETRLYQNNRVYPRVWLQQSNKTNAASVIPVQISSWNTDRVVLQTEDIGLLVLSELAYPGWQVRVNGQSRELETAYGLLRAVRLDNPGLKQVEFVFRPLSVYLGCMISFFTIIILVIFIGMQHKKRSIE